MADLMIVSWYATVLRQKTFAVDVAEVAALSLRYGATEYRVHVNNDDRYKVNQLCWFPKKTDWYRYWDGPEMIEFRARNMGHYQVPIAYAWADEIAVGSLGPEVPVPEPDEPQPEHPAPLNAA